MKPMGLVGAAIAALGFATTPLAAQKVEAEVAGETTAATSLAIKAAPANKPCELHVWPTENYIVGNGHIMSGYGGALGALASEIGEKRSLTVEDLVRDTLAPEAQMQELEKLAYMSQLELASDEYEVILQEPTPSINSRKENPEIKAWVKTNERKIKDGERITDSTTPCYAEFITTHIFFQKALMSGWSFHTGWTFRKFDGDEIILEGMGHVGNRIKKFPPKEEAMIDTARADLRDVYARNFAEWLEKKSGL